MVNDPLHLREENHGVTMFRSYFHITQGYDHIFKVTEATWKDILCSPKRSQHCRPLLGYSLLS